MSRLCERYRTAWVTGASSGLGQAFAQMLVQEGIAVWATARHPGRLDGLVAAFPGRVTPVGLDLADPERAVAAFEAASGEDGFDIVINNAGYGVFGEFGAAPADAWAAQVFEMLGTTVRLCHAAWRSWDAGRRPRCLVNVSSLAAEFPLPFLCGYNAAKAGLSAVSESLMYEARGRAIAVIDFRPGDYRTPFNRAARVHQPVSPRARAVWAVLERNLEAAPSPGRAAKDLRGALFRGRSGVVRSGGYFQARLAPCFARLMPQSWLRAIAARYFGVR